jgi:subtilisin family serine protease
MKSKISYLSLAMIVVSLAGCMKNDGNLADQDVSLNLNSLSVNNKYIVVLNDDAEPADKDVNVRKSRVLSKADDLKKRHSVSEGVEDVYETAIHGFSIRMTPGQLKKMGEDKDVKYIEPDQIIALSPIEANGKPSGGTTQPVQSTPWGITRVGGGITYTGTNVVWIIDTGVDLTHPDLNVDKVRGKSFVSRVTSPNDDNGHGSHVAGTIAAKNNTIGVIGVAAGALVVPVKVLDSRGSGTTTSVISGINYVLANGKAGDVANMSLGGGVSAALDDAVLKASVVVKFALAAGNETDNANNHSPARVNGPNIYTISAMGTGDLWASFSNYGNPPVDYCAPGVSILSTYKGGGYATLSGTSMATPHFAGLLLLGNIVTNGNVLNDPDGVADPIAHH